MKEVVGPTASEGGDAAAALDSVVGGGVGTAAFAGGQTGWYNTTTGNWDTSSVGSHPAGDAWIKTNHDYTIQSVQGDEGHRTVTLTNPYDASPETFYGTHSFTMSEEAFKKLFGVFAHNNK